MNGPVPTEFLQSCRSYCLATSTGITKIQSETLSHTLENQPGFDLIEQVPTTWDETRVLSAKVGDYIVLARRKGSDWYIGAMTDWTPRTLDVPLNFLPAGSYQAEIWSDTPETEKNPNILVKDQRTVAAQDRIQAKLAAGGGWVMHIKSADR